MAAIPLLGPSRPPRPRQVTFSTTTPTPPMLSVSCTRTISLRSRSSLRFRPVARLPSGEHPLSGKGEAHCRGRIFFLDVNPLCYEGTSPSFPSFARWLSLLLSQVCLRDPVVAVLDGDGGSEYRRRLLPSYKSHRRSPSRGSMELRVKELLHNCHVPVIKVNGYEADDVIATLTDQVLKEGFRVVVASPDKDFKQLLCENVQIVMPMSRIGRWSFYTSKHYAAQYNCDPSSDLSLRSILGDEVDGVPGIQHLVPGFGLRTALKLLRQHRSLENLLNAASVRTVGKAYVQDALVGHADYLRRNYQLLSLKRDIDIHIEDSWLFKRDSNKNSFLPVFLRKLDESGR